MSRGQVPPASPFFKPTTPHVVVVQQTPGGTRRRVKTAEEVKEHKSDLVGCVANLMNAIVGSGIVGIAYAVKQAGFGAGIFLILFTAVLTEKSLRLLIATAKHVHVPSFEVVSEAAFGAMGFRFVAISMFVMAYGAMLSYLMIVKDIASTLLGVASEDHATRRAVLVVISLAIMVPLSSQRDMADLAKTSRLSVILDTILVSMVAYNAPIAANLERLGGLGTLLRTDTIHPETIFVGLGVLSFAFVCQHSAFIIAGSLDRPTLRRWSIVTGWSLVLCAMLALTSGMAGYIGYLDKTNGNILNNLDAHSPTANLARAMLGTTMLFVYPMESFVARHVLVVLLFEGRRAHEGDDTAILNRRDRRIGLTVLLYLAGVIPASIFEDFGSVLAATGAVGGSCLSYIGPGAIYLGVHGGRFLELVQGSKWFGSIAQQNDTVQRPTFAVETTPLVASTSSYDDDAAVIDEHDKDTFASEAFIVRACKYMTWWLTGMPIWYAIASAGKRSLTKHIHDMALKSPHPIRIGDVEYKVARVTSKGYVESDVEGGAVLVAPGSETLPQGSYVMSRPAMHSNKLSPISSASDLRIKGGVGINQQIGKMLLEQQQQQKKQGETAAAAAALEKDPQESPPSWYDFFVAIFFVFYGVVAMTAGLISLFR